MTDFVESFTTQQLLPPWHSHDAETWMFLIHVHPDLMADYLDRHFNDGGPDVAPYYYEPWSDPCFGFLQVVDHPRFSSEHAQPDHESFVHDHEAHPRPDDCQHWDTVSHAEVFFSFPARRYRRTEDNLLVEPKLVWIQPFYFDSSSYVMFSSREIWGSEKEMAKIQINQGKVLNDLHIDVSIEGFETFNPHSVAKSIGAIHLRMDEKAKRTTLAEVRDKNSHLAKIIKSLDGHLPPEWTDEKPVRTLSLPEFQINTLKQYRDVFDMHDAVYRAIIASQVEHSDIREMSVFHGDHVKVDFMWSDSMKEQYERLFGMSAPKKNSRRGHRGKGLRNDEGDTDWDLHHIPMKVHLAIFFKSDAFFDVLGTLYTYGGGPQYPPPEGAVL